MSFDEDCKYSYQDSRHRQGPLATVSRRLAILGIKKNGSSLNYMGELCQRIWPLFLCVSVVGSEHSGSPQSHRDTEN